LRKHYRDAAAYRLTGCPRQRAQVQALDAIAVRQRHYMSAVLRDVHHGAIAGGEDEVGRYRVRCVRSKSSEAIPNLCRPLIYTMRNAVNRPQHPWEANMKIVDVSVRVFHAHFTIVRDSDGHQHPGAAHRVRQALLTITATTDRRAIASARPKSSVRT
jgi:hypothetical protein